MPLVNSLLTAILRADGDALVLHVGERPYVVTGVGNVDLSKTVLTLEVVSGMVAQLLPEDLLATLSEVGAVEHQLQPPSSMRDAFTVVAARGGDDIWIEIRRKRAVVRAAAAPIEETKPTEVARSNAPSHVTAPASVEAIAEPTPMAASAPPPSVPPDSAPADEREADEREEMDARTTSELVAGAGAAGTQPSEPDVLLAQDGAEAEPPAPPIADPHPEPLVEDARVFEVASMPSAVESHPLPHSDLPEPEPERTSERRAAPDEQPIPEAPVPEPAIVVPLTRVVRVEPPRMMAKEHSVERLLAFAAARSGEQIYLTSQSRPFLRVEGEMRAIENESTFSAADIEAIALEVMPESARESHRRGEPAEWSSEFEGVGRVRCATFRDHRGPGLVFQLTTTKPIAAEQLGLTPDIQSLATEPEGLVVVAGPRGAGKSTLVGALVDLINKQHSVSVITIERQIRIVHDNRLALVSQREVRGTGADTISVVRAALRENPDVLVIEDLKSPEIVQLALDASGTGRLVILTLTAGATVSALTRIVESFPPASRKAAQAALGERLRGAVSQALLRKAGGGRIAARELLLSSPSVTSLVAEGLFPQITSLLDNGRKPGLVSLNHVLLSLVKSGEVDASEAYRKAENRSSLLAMLERDGIDTSLLGRLA